MKKERGLKRIYRFAGVAFNYILFKITKKLNPNTITVSGFIVHIIGCLQLLIMFFIDEITYLNIILLIIAFQISLIIDYVDGEYARKVNRCTIVGKYLDGILDFIKLSITYVLIYFITKNHFYQLLILTCSVTLALFMWSKYIVSTLNLEKKSPKEGKFLSLSLFFSFSVPHQYLYFSIFLLFGVWQILILMIALGLAFILKNFIKIMKVARKRDKAQ